MVIPQTIQHKNVKEKKMMKWISIKNKLPKDFRDVLITDGKQVGVGYRYLRPPETKWTDYIGLTDEENITHWMPLPKSPKKK